MRGIQLGTLLMWLVPAMAGAGTLTSASFLTVPLSVRQAGMGEVGAGGTDVLRSWCNPALLAMQETHGEVAAGGASMFGEQASLGFGAGWALGPDWTVGAFLASTGISVEELDAAGIETKKSVSQDNMAFGPAVAWQWDWLAFGVAGRYITESIGGFSDSAMAGDIGAAARWGSLSLATSLRNLAGSLYKAGNDTVILPRELRAGAAYFLDSPGLSGGVEYATFLSGSSAPPDTLNCGVEWWPAKMFGLRAGLVQTMVSGGPPMVFTAGLTGVYHGIALDYAISTHDIGLSNRASLSWAFGGNRTGAAEAAPQAAVKTEVIKPAPIAGTTLESSVAAKPAAVSATPLTMAVAEFVAAGVPAEDSARLAEILRSALAGTSRYVVFDRQAMNKVLAGQSLPRKGCAEEGCAIRAGRLLKVQRMLVASLDNAGTYILIVRMVDPAAGRTVYTDSVSGRRMAELEAGVRSLAVQMGKQPR